MFETCSKLIFRIPTSPLATLFYILFKNSIFASIISVFKAFSTQNCVSDAIMLPRLTPKMKKISKKIKNVFKHVRNLLKIKFQDPYILIGNYIQYFALKKAFFSPKLLFSGRFWLKSTFVFKLYGEGLG